MQFTCNEIADILNGEIISGDPSTIINDIGIDSRYIKSNQLFIPIIGENFDGHDFIKSAIDNGAAAALTQKNIEFDFDKNRVIIKVRDTKYALACIAKRHRMKFNIPVIGITGSVGKTSTKDMVACVLSKKYNTLKTQGNFNNEIGLPLTLYNLNEFHQAAVVEMGMSGIGEIQRLSITASPTISIITNIGLSHIEKLGSLDNILKAKLEIIDGMDENNGPLILNGDDLLLNGIVESLKRRCILYGTAEYNHFQAIDIEPIGKNGISFTLNYNNAQYNVLIPNPGRHNVYNALAAIAVGVELKIEIDKIIEGIREFVPSKMRLDILDLNGITVINDSYNASPASMEAAFDVLKELGIKGRTFAVLGDMLEMGSWSNDAHVNIGKKLFEKGIDFVYTTGKSAGFIISGAVEAGMEENKTKEFITKIDICNFLEYNIKPGDAILVKGSRGMKMEEIIDFLKLRIQTK